MRPDQLVARVILMEGQRLSKTREYRRFKPAVVRAVDKLLADLEPPHAVPAKVRTLAQLYREQLDGEDIVDAAKELGLEKQADELCKLLTPRLYQLYGSILLWNDDGSVEARLGETALGRQPVEPPFVDGKLHGDISYGEDHFRFAQGYRLPEEKLTAALIDSHYGDDGFHAALVNLYGVEAYLKESELTRVDERDGIKLMQTDRYAWLYADGAGQRCPARMHSLDDAIRWLRTKEA